MRRSIIKFCRNIVGSDTYSDLLTNISHATQYVQLTDLDAVVQNGAGIQLPNGYCSKNIDTKQSGYGSDAWFSAEISKISKHSESWFLSEYKNIVARFREVQPYVRQYVTQNEVLDTSYQLHSMKINFFGLTIRGYSPLVCEKLLSLGVHFTTLNHDIVSIGEHPKAQNKDIVFAHGIIFCDGAPKGDVFRLFSDVARRKKWISSQISTVGFIDDSMKHCEDVHESILQHGWTPRIFHFSYVKNRIPIAASEEMKNDAEAFEKYLMDNKSIR